MPVVDVALWDLQRLTRAGESEVLKAFEHIKGEVEEQKGDRLRIEVSHDRPDHFSAEGLARSIKGILGVETGLPKASVVAGGVSLEYVGVIEERPYAVMAIVRDLSLDDESLTQIIQLQEKIHETYGRDRKKVAIGFYDLSKIKPPIYYKRISQEDEYTPLGFDKPIKVKEMYELTDKGRRYSPLVRREAPPALVDSDGKIMVVIPILGSECCKVTPQTRDVLIDVTGHSVEALTKILSILVYSLLERSRSKVVELVKINGRYIDPTQPRSIGVRKEDIEDVLGLKMSSEEYIDALRRARHDVDDGNVKVAPYRINLLSWIDLAEDVAIIKGYNALPRAPPLVASIGRRHAVEVLTEDARRQLLSLGFQEVMGGVLGDAGLYRMFGTEHPLILNPVSETLNAVRSSLVPGLLYAASRQRRPHLKLFEVGDVVVRGRTVRSIAYLISGENITITDGASVLTALCGNLGLRCVPSNVKLPWCIEGRCAQLTGDLAGYIGEVHPQILERLEIYRPIVVAEMFL